MKTTYLQPTTEIADMMLEGQLTTASYVLNEDNDLKNIISGGGQYEEGTMHILSRMDFFPEF